MFTTRGRFVLSAAAGALLVGAGLAALSSGPAVSAPSPSTFTVDVAQSCTLQRIGDQFVKCDNLTGAGVRAPAFVPSVLPAVVPTHLSGFQRIGLGDYR